jgi:enolase
LVFRIESLTAMEILDSRGRPTIAAAAIVNGRRAEVSIPSGASTGAAEALELRDGDPARYGGLGCLRAVSNVNDTIVSALVGKTFASQSQLDEALIALDGTPNKATLAANAILATSLAFARACAAANGVPLYRHFASLAKTSPRLPQLTVNLFSGGKHAGGQVPIQDVLLVPIGAPSIAVALERVVAVVRAAQKLVVEKYDQRPLKADEGGLAPPFQRIESMFDDAVECIRRAGLESGNQMALAVDVASSHFYANDMYDLGDQRLTSRQMIERISSWLDRWPIISIEDGLSESDWDNWPLLRQALAGRAMVLGDDLLCTNPERIRRAVASAAADALLLKVNQIGTLTEAAEALRVARDAGWKITVSARSGETEDNWLADLATGWAADQIKVGSVQQSERLAKYNRLLAIEREQG